ncbi:hypothetical protein ABK040_006847 [Willaertia magna]
MSELLLQEEISLFQQYHQFLQQLSSEDNNTSNQQEQIKEDYENKIIEYCTLLKTKCINNEHFQNQLKNSFILKYLINIIEIYLLNKDSINRKCLQNILQLLINSITSNELNQEYIFNETNIFKNILNLIKLEKNITFLTCLFIYNCISKNENILHFIFNNNLLMIELLDYLYETSKTKEWIYFIFKKYLNTYNHDYFFENEILLKDHFITKPLQKRILNFFEIMEQFTSEEIKNSEEQEIKKEIYLKLLKCHFYLLNENVINKIYLENNKNIELFNYFEFECLFVNLQCIANYCVLLTDELDINFKEKITIFIIKLLRLSILEKEIKSDEDDQIIKEVFLQTGLLVTNNDENNNNEEEEHENGTEMFYGYKTLLIRILANVTFKSKVIQDLIRKEEGLPLILSCCSIEDNNPYLREWGVFCVRNVCEDNPENQEYISQMKAQQVDEKTQQLLKEKGMKAEITENGKVKIVKEEHEEE